MFNTDTGSSCNLRPNGSGDEPTATVGANILQNLVNTLFAESAFIGAYHCVNRVDW